MSAERAHLRLVPPVEVAPDPSDPTVWRPGLRAARAALAAGHKRPEAPGTGPDGSSAGSDPPSFRPRLPAVEHAWHVLHGGHEEGQR